MVANQLTFRDLRAARVRTHAGWVKRALLLAFYALATAQVAGCYFTLVRPYVNTYLYENGRERLPFQTRILMAPLMRWAHNSTWAAQAAGWLSHSYFWYLRPAEPEAVVQYVLNVASLALAGYMTHRIYCAATRRPGNAGGLLAPFIYPFFLLLCIVHYILHTIQNFRFIYDLPSVAFFSVGLYLIYFRKHPLLFAALFLVATTNRETALLLLAFYVLSACSQGGRFDWRQSYGAKTLWVVVPLGVAWYAWHVFIFHTFKYNVSEYYPRLSLNLYTLAHVRYWPQLLSAGGYIFPFLLLFRRKVVDVQLRMWLLVLPLWFGFMFFWGILVETRIFGELLPYVTCVAVLIAEDAIVGRVQQHENRVARVQISGLPAETVACDERASA